MTTTIIIPAYNTPLVYFNEMLRSLEQQTKQDFKVIIIDDGSQLPVSYSGRLSVNIIRFEENRGIVAALNHAIEQVDTEIILRMDADDICSPVRVERTMRYLQENPEVEFGCTSIEVISVQRGHQRLAPPDEPTLRSALPISNPIAHPSCFFRSYVLKNHGYVGLVQGMEDYLLWMNLMEADVRFGSIQEALLTYRVHPENWTQANASSRRHRWIQFMTHVWAHVHRAPLVTDKVIEDVSYLLYPEKTEGPQSWEAFRERLASAYLYAEGLNASGYKHPPNENQIKVIGRRAVFQWLDLGAKPCFHRDVVSLVGKFEQLRYFSGKRFAVLE